VGDRRLAGLALNNLGFTYDRLSQYEKALSCYEQALVLAREVGNREGEERDLNQLGRVYLELSQYEKALPFHEQALTIARAVGDRQGEGWPLLNLGVAYAGLSQYDKALPCYEQALVLAREVGDRRLAGLALSNLGRVYSELSQYDQARTFYEQALVLAREVGDRGEEGWAFNNLGFVYQALGQYDKALPSYEQALVLAREVGNRRGEALTLANLGGVYQALGQYDQALISNEQALVLARKAETQSVEGLVLRALGFVYQALRQYDQALTFYEQALTTLQKVGYRLEEGNTFNALGRVYQALGQYDQALTYAEHGLSLARTVGNRDGEGWALSTLSDVYTALGQYDQALTHAEQALMILREVGDREGTGWAFGQLMAVWKAQHQPRLAIFYGKQAVNMFQEIRGFLLPLAHEFQEGFLTSRTPVYRQLAELLIAAGRLPEAQQVLNLLKAEEYLDFVRRDAPTATALQGQATLTPEEAGWTQRYRAIADRLAALGTEYGALRRKPVHTAADTQRLEALEADLGVARQAFEQFLAQLQTEARQAPQSQERLAHLTEESQGLMDALRDLGPGTVALYTLVTDTAYRVILTTPEVQLAREFPIAPADLARKVLAFRDALDPGRPGGLRRDPRPLARELYQILVAPIAQDLQQAHAQTLMWSLDGVLRYLSLAALHDGAQYLLERYRLVVFTPASATRLKDLPQHPWRGVGFGVSKAHEGFTALPTVPDELRGIIRDATQRNAAGVLPGLIHLDEAFTDATLRAALRQHYPVVHIASHFQLHPGDDTASFLLLGDGSHLALAQLKTWPQPFEGVELLTLSACNTAVGSPGAEGQEVEGLAVLAQRQGAKAVVATLWPVADASTQVLMQTFYRLRESRLELPKVEALRQAQLALLRGAGLSGATTQLGGARSLDLIKEAPSGAGLPPFVPDPQAPYAHPAYWAPYVLMGNLR
jgi:CHAT domain-containing protein/Tfp pilus assembly protein PilF